MAPAMQLNQEGRDTSCSRKRKAKEVIVEAPPVGGVNMGFFLFEKRLTHSDVNGQNRMIIPKGYAEKCFGELAKLGSSCPVFMEDIGTGRVWKFCFRSWQNSGSRMYVLEGVGKYAQEQNIKVGDFIMLYQNDQTDRYQISYRKKVDQEKHNHPGDDGVEKEEPPAKNEPPASTQVDCAGKNEVEATSSEVAFEADEYHPQFLPQDETSQFFKTSGVVIDADYVLKNFNMTWEEFLNYNALD
ncbi:B3 domain-containing protein VP1-like [Apium graveolens]|uniref:B3 domain-containing protein VP1-like n=1 Tax=Apium graveolens TaxID=4045 RepID=UPI003D794735